MPQKHFVLIKRDGPDRNGKELSALASAQLLLDAKSWPIWDTMRNRKLLAAGDRLAIYLAGTSEVFATATISKIDKWNSVHANRYPLTLDGTPVAAMILDKVQTLQHPVKVREHLQALSFINQDTRKWGVAFMGGCRAVNDADFRILTTSIAPCPVPPGK